MTSPERVWEVLERLAPLRLAGSWDNVGLLVEGTRPIGRIRLCIDLGEPVLAEALADGADLVVAYHPPLFAGVKRLGSRVPTERVLLAAIRSGVHVWSPHSALDAAPDGMTDWLVAAAGPVVDGVPVTPDRLDPRAGPGRRATLVDPAPLEALLPRIKAYLGIDALRVAGAPDMLVRTIAVCPGAGASVLATASADLWLTGELRHHDVLGQVAAGGAVVLTDHTNSERGYLPILAQRIRDALPGVDVSCSQVDADPLSVR